MTIALLCPSRQRILLFKRMVDSARNTAFNKEDIHIYLGISDTEWPEYEKEVGGCVTHVTTFPEGCPTTFKWNMMAKHAVQQKHTHYMLAADDMIFTTPHWDKELKDHYAAHKQKQQVYSLRDSRDENGTPHPIVTHEYIEAMDYFLPPIFLHWFVDTWTVEIAKANNCFTHLKDYMLVHDKPFHRGEPDDTHMCIRRNGWLNNDMWTNEKCQHFLEHEKLRLARKLTAEHHAEYMMQFVDM